MKWHEMKVSAFVAFRYFFAKKNTHAVNIIAIISVLAIMLVTTAMVCVLSVFNGFEEFTSSRLSTLSSAYRIERTDGQPFSAANLHSLLPDDGSLQVAPLLTTKALAGAEENYTVVELQGIDEHYVHAIPIEDYVFEGRFDTGNDPQIPEAIVGIGVGAHLGVGADYFTPIEVTLPPRTGRISATMPMKSFRRVPLHVAGVFRVDQPEDNSYLFLPIATLRELLDYEGDEVSALLLAPVEGMTFDKEATKHKLPEGFELKDRVQQHPDVYKVLKIEKWVSFALLLFVLLLSLFSVISTLGMLIIEKREDMRTLAILGANDSMRKHVTLFEGWLLSVTGLLLGLVIGLLLTWIQLRFGVIKLGGDGSGAFLIDAYPVKIVWTDILGVIATILAVGWLSSLLAHRIFTKNAQQSA